MLSYLERGWLSSVLRCGAHGGAVLADLVQLVPQNGIHSRAVHDPSSDAAGLARAAYGLSNTATSANLCAMPTVLRDGPYRFFFYAGDGGEPPHVHVERDENEAKFWLEAVRLASSRGFNGQELRRIETLVRNNQDRLLESWNEYFRGQAPSGQRRRRPR
jgi:hypothetical protein